MATEQNHRLVNIAQNDVADSFSPMLLRKMSLLLGELNDGPKQELERVRKINMRQETEIKKIKRELKRNNDIIERKDHTIKALEVELRYRPTKLNN